MNTFVICYILNQSVVVITKVLLTRQRPMSCSENWAALFCLWLCILARTKRAIFCIHFWQFFIQICISHWICFTLSHFNLMKPLEVQSRGKFMMWLGWDRTVLLTWLSQEKRTPYHENSSVHLFQIFNFVSSQLCHVVNFIPWQGIFAELCQAVKYFLTES